MHKVFSRTPVRAAAAALVTVLIGALLTASPASAAPPQAPGNFRGYGFDACVAPSQKTMDTWNLTSPYSAIGIYISGNSRYCSDKYQPNLSKSWVQKNANNGWRFIPIHVGYQAPCFKNNPKSRVQKKRMSSNLSTARKQAVSDAKESVAAAKKYGFGSGTVLYLDIEWYSRSGSCDAVVLAFSESWTEYLHKVGYKSGLYSSGSAAIEAMDIQRAKNMSGYTLPDHMWIAWTNKVANTDGGPYLSDSGWKNHQRIHQYHNGVTVSYGGVKINIDKNFLDVGKGSVASAEPKPCGVKMSFAKYPSLKIGSQGAEVAALQCLLKQRGLKKSVNGKFGRGTMSGVNKFRKSKGWATTNHVTRPTWTALLAEGRSPRVLKYGSVGSDVWRIQRSLTAATGKKQTINGKFESSTVNAVLAYRKKNKLPSYSTAESKVWSALNKGKLG